MDGPGAVDGDGRNLSGNVFGSARRVKVRRVVFAKDAAQNGQRVADKEPHGHQEDDDSNGQGLGRVVSPSDGVLEAPDAKERDGKEAGGEVYALDPAESLAHLLEESARDKTSDKGRQRVEETQGGVEGSVPVDSQQAHQRQQDRCGAEADELRSNAQNGAKQLKTEKHLKFHQNLQTKVFLLLPFSAGGIGKRPRG